MQITWCGKNNYSYSALHQNEREIDETDRSIDMSTNGLLLELVGETKNRKKYWIMGGGVIAVIIALIIVAVVLLTGESAAEGDRPPAMTLNDFLFNKFSAARFNGTWISDTEIEYQDEDGYLSVYNAETKTKKILLNSEIVAGSFLNQRSPDQKYILMAFDYIKIYRHTFKAKYSVLEVATGQVTPIRINNDPESFFDLMLWGLKDSQLIYVFENNFYFKASVEAAPLQVTFDGKPATIYNGVPDWVYEEEIFSSNSAVWFSPDGSSLAFAKFIDTDVPVMNIPVYGPVGAAEFQYTKSLPIKYPKAGSTNPTVSLHVVDLKNNPTTPITLDIPVELQSEKREPILAAVTWANANTVAAVWMNRVQNRAYVITCQATTAGTPCKTVHTLTSTTGWVELFTPPMFNSDGSKMILIEPVQINNDKFRHVVLVSLAPYVVTPLTTGEFTVTEILKWDHARDFIYFMATTPEDPGVLNLYRVSENKNVTCASCQVAAAGSYHSAEISKDGSYFVLSTDGPNVPEINIYNSKSFEHIGFWEENSNVNEMLSKTLLPQTLRLKVEISNGFTAQVKLLLPADLDTSGDTKYPMIVNVYGGPDSFQVTEKWGIDWGTYLASNKSIIYAAIDGRGSGLKGERMLHANYRALGTVEISDQINITKHLQDTLGYIDRDKTAIWGWSYGGYATALALGQDTNDVFKCGVSVAPVTDWRLYDSIYTERFMGLPESEDNLRGYERSLAVNFIENFRNKKYFLVHGTYDDNVHFQQAMMFARMLELRDILFEQMTYSDEDHSLARVRPHLYHSLEHFFNDCFDLPS